MGLIQDITPVKKTLDIPAYLRGYGQRGQAKCLKTEVMVKELYRRGYSVEEIFADFYALQASADDRDGQIFGSSEEGNHGTPLTVGDAQLAGGIAPKPGVRQPF